MHCWLVNALVVVSWSVAQARGTSRLALAQVTAGDEPSGLAATLRDPSTGRDLPADINGDGRGPDLAVSSPATNSLSLYFNSGSGLFSAPLELDGLQEPQGVVLGDFDGDGRVDVAVLNLAGYTVSTFFGENFCGPVTVGVTGYPRGLVAGRFHSGERYDDLVVVTSTDHGLVGAVTVMTTGGSRTWRATTMAVDAEPRHATVGDFGTDPTNAAPDGRLDFAVTLRGAAQVRLYYGDGHGGFTPDPRDYGANQQPIHIVSADFDGDGCTDVLVTNHGTTGDHPFSAISLLPGRCSGSAGSFGNASSVVTLTDPNAHPGFLTTITRDHTTDFAMIDVGTERLWLFLNETQLPGFPVFSELVCATDRMPHGIAAGDFNDDGEADVAVATHGHDTIEIFSGSGAGLCAAPLRLGTGPRLGDANCDGAVSAPDLTTVVRWTSPDSSGTCGADTNLDHRVDHADLDGVISRVFSRFVSRRCDNAL